MRVVIVGTGLISELLIAGFKEVGIEVFACVGRDEMRVKEFATKNNVPYHACDYDRVLQSEQFDTVYLGVPNSLHYIYAKKALLAGKNVICEKPLTSNLKEAKELVLLANSKDLLLFDACITPHNAAYKLLKQDIKMLGKIRAVDVQYLKYSRNYNKFLNGEIASSFNPQYSGGALMDLGIYNIEFICGLFGLPKRCQYFANMQRGIDTSGVSILEYDDFVVSSIAGKDSNLGASFNIMAEKGNIYSYQDNSTFNRYNIELNDGTKVARNFPNTSKYYQELIDFKSMYEYHSIRKNNEYLKITLMSMKILDELRNSASITFETIN